MCWCDPYNVALGSSSRTLWNIVQEISIVMILQLRSRLSPSQPGLFPGLEWPVPPSTSHLACTPNRSSWSRRLHPQCITNHHGPPHCDPVVQMSLSRSLHDLFVSCCDLAMRSQVWSSSIVGGRHLSPGRFCWFSSMSHKMEDAYRFFFFFFFVITSLCKYAFPCRYIYVPGNTNT